jgi:hypothetical protein
MVNTKEAHLDMMNNPGRWPRWPFLPLVNEDNRLGILLDSGKEKIVLLSNLFLMPQSYEDAELIKYQSYEAVYEAGWRVD